MTTKVWREEYYQQNYEDIICTLEERWEEMDEESRKSLIENAIASAGYIIAYRNP